MLVEKFLQALNHDEICGISIATRPDCLKQNMLKKINLLAIQTRKYVSIEFGLQTSNEQTAEYINRQFENAEYVDAIKRIKRINKNIHIVTHLIFGLPNESQKDMIDSVSFALKSGTDGLKIQVLNILRGTKLEAEYLQGNVKPLEMQEYFEIVKNSLKIIPSKIVIHRLTGDGAKKLLIAPQWVADKKKVLSIVNSL